VPTGTCWTCGAIRRDRARDLASRRALIYPGQDDRPRLAYLRVADDIAAQIASGELAPGARLRSERDLAAHYGVSYGTIRRAMEVLRDRSLIT